MARIRSGTDSAAPDPEAPPHVEIFGARPLVARDHLRLERHAADRAGAGALLPDLRMHGAGVDGL